MRKTRFLQNIISQDYYKARELNSSLSISYFIINLLLIFTPVPVTQKVHIQFSGQY